MERNVTIDGREYRLVANGATPRIYRGMFRSDVFKAMTHSLMDNGEVSDTEVFENLAFVMAMQGGSVSTGAKIEDWLGGMSSPTAIMEAVPDILSLWTDEAATTSVGKKE